ncbi:MULTISPECIES: hypothetical protein [Cryobacterium]|uniref:Alkaline shock response membrane anchor protein AmaP n=1 Tax=Cryobacterium breve TaxID=1259258 RepID=A0ABY2J164_9MICO|nr:MULTISPECIES: hypothetical protein [Cryobacterium]TFC94112.1 hypothetical protein E3T20_09090 [Cryobacterium sp. TmT3-12]TFC98657.1 hypothetical protein E3O65_07200 [Cryobacterium breve]
MNSTNRVLNRGFIFLVGLLILVVGATLTIVAAVPVVRERWAAATSAGVDTVTRWLQATPMPDFVAPLTGSWLWLIAIAAGVSLIAALAVFSLRQGHGHTGRLASVNGNNGAVAIETKVAEQAIQDALAKRPELVDSHVSTYLVRHRPTLKVAITCRRGISPRAASNIVDEVLSSFDDLLGLRVPALVQISGGFRARTSQGARLH